MFTTTQNNVKKDIYTSNNYQVRIELSSKTNLIVVFLHNLVHHKHYMHYIKKDDIKSDITLESFFKLMQHCFRNNFNNNFMVNIRHNLDDNIVSYIFNAKFNEDYIIIEHIDINLPKYPVCKIKNISYYYTKINQSINMICRSKNNVSLPNDIKNTEPIISKFIKIQQLNHKLLELENGINNINISKNTLINQICNTHDDKLLELENTINNIKISENTKINQLENQICNIINTNDAKILESNTKINQLENNIQKLEKLIDKILNEEINFGGGLNNNNFELIKFSKNIETIDFTKYLATCWTNIQEFNKFTSLKIITAAINIKFTSPFDYIISGKIYLPNVTTLNLNCFDKCTDDNFHFLGLPNLTKVVIENFCSKISKNFHLCDTSSLFKYNTKIKHVTYIGWSKINNICHIEQYCKHNNITIDVLL